MKSYQEKVLSGESVSAEEWVQYLKQAHHESPAMSPKAFDDGRTEAGRNSYQELAAELSRVNPVERILDLACGDGHLTRYIRDVVGTSANIVGVDMSPAELALARRQFPDVTFKAGLAQKLEESDSSFDAVLCHMVLMLMSPVMPVLHEVQRVLRSGGVFAGVVNSSNASGFLVRYAQELSSFTRERYPDFKPNFAGDPRVIKIDGLRELLSSAGFVDVSVREFVMTISGTPERAASFFRDMYNVTLLPPSARTEFINHLTAVAREACAGSETMSFGFPMLLFSARRS